MSKDACLIIPTNQSSFSTWIEWHKSLKSCVGKSQANQLWMMNFDKEMPGDSVELREYMEEQGVQLDRDVLDRLTDTGKGVFDFIGNSINFGSTISKIIVLIIVGGAGLMIYNIVKTPEGAKRLGAAIGTRGMSEAGQIGGGQKAIGQ
jgi:hypothetical protein|tara:strand:+ start:7586 stop:8029 length:444 start_codon:yes stop_codon:yes gene_type:complete